MTIDTEQRVMVELPMKQELRANQGSNPMFLFHLICLLSFFGGLFCSSPSEAGVFNIPHFVSPGEYALGVEPEFVFSNGGGAGVNARYTQGISELNNLTAIVGTGSGPRLFRIGGAFTFDFFPDVGSQPGIGLAVQGLYVNVPGTGSVETTAIPYIHKSIKTDLGTPIEPFFALPIGLSLHQGLYDTISTAVIGALFQHNEHVRSVLELGISLSNSNSYISGGFVYYH